MSIFEYLRNFAVPAGIAAGSPPHVFFTRFSKIVPHRPKRQAVTALQLMGGEGNLLASAVVTSYATFLCFSAVSKTPTEDCNPFVGESNIGVTLIGIGLTVLSLVW